MWQFERHPSPTVFPRRGHATRSMTRVRDLTPDDAAELTALYGEYEWWADRDAENVRRAL